MKHTSQDERKISLGPATVLISILALLVTFAQAYFARQTMRMEQRAWINYSFGQSSMVVGQPLDIPVHLVDIGRTPARNVHGAIVVHKLAKDEEPAFSLSHGMSVEAGLMFPNVPQDVHSVLIPTIVPSGEKPNPIILDRPTIDAINDGSAFTLVYGRIVYEDMFDVPHWFQFCAMGGISKYGQPKTCVEFNRVDDNND